MFVDFRPLWWFGLCGGSASFSFVFSGLPCRLPERDPTSARVSLAGRRTRAGLDDDERKEGWLKRGSGEFMARSSSSTSVSGAPSGNTLATPNKC